MSCTLKYYYLVSIVNQYIYHSQLFPHLFIVLSFLRAISLACFSPLALRISQSSSAKITSSGSSSPSSGHIVSGMYFKNRLIGKVTRAMRRQYSHCVPVRPFQCTCMNLPKNCTQMIWNTTIMVQTMRKAGLLKMPSKMFIWSAIFLEQIMLKICMNTNRLNTIDRWRDGVMSSNSLQIGFYSVSCCIPMRM